MRLSSINTFRTIGLLAIICIHTQPFGGDTYSNIKSISRVGVVVNQGARVAVPFFFIAAGYYFAEMQKRGGDPVTLLFLYSKKTLHIFFAWCLVYAIIPDNLIVNVWQNGPVKTFHLHFDKLYDFAVKYPLDFAMQGTKVHLWFLPGFVIGLAILSFVCKYRFERYLMVIATGLYIVGLLGGSYSQSTIGLSLPLNTRNGPFFSTLFIAAGWWISSFYRQNRNLAFVLFIGGAFLHFTEVVFLYKLYRIGPTSHNYLIGTFFWGIGAFLLALNYPTLGKDSLFEDIGKVTLGIYVSHYLIIYALKPVDYFVYGIAWEITKPILVLFMSYYFSIGLARYSFTRKCFT
jgi:surface polysaccharide O-acyltransferase-like enzyme